MAVCCCRMSHVQAIHWLCDSVDDGCDDNVDVGDSHDAMVADKLSPTPAVTSSPSALHKVNFPVGFLFHINCWLFT